MLLTLKAIMKVSFLSSSSLILNPSFSRVNSAILRLPVTGSFGHHTAKEFALKGQFSPPQPNEPLDDGTNIVRRKTMEGLAKTRLSVQRLNQLLVSSLVAHGVNAVAISPCFAIPNMQAHGGDQDTTHRLVTVIRDTLHAGLVPVLHGDACLYGRQSAGILSGDILVEKLGQRSFFSQVVFLTDVDGVFSRDPRDDPTAVLLRYIQVDKNTLDIVVGGSGLNVTGSSHDHDVTGGLKVSTEGGSSRPFAVEIQTAHR
jgi:isopentenyl phosphate kinase